MNTAERISFAIVLLVGGFAAGMYVEHERFLREIQGLSKKHADTPKPVEPTADSAA